MALITEFSAFLVSVVFISLSGVLLPGPLFALTLKKAVKNPYVGVLISIGHGIVELPLMLLIYFALDQFTAIPPQVEIIVGISGGLFMILMGIQTYKNRNKVDAHLERTTQDSIIAGVWATAANAGFILWWLTVGTTLIISAKQFYGFLGFTVFAGVHWLCDFFWYAAVAILIFKSVQFWSPKTHKAITYFCIGVLFIFGAIFLGSAVQLAIKTLM
jgi:threonine/homoserine/homoserine lactone efflux protein